MSTEFKTIATREFPEFSTYSGPATVAEFTFRNVAGLSAVGDLVLNTIVIAQTKLADATPLQAVLQERRLEIPYLPDIISEYHLILHYHESPLIIAVTLAIAAALTAAGFLVMTIKSNSEAWSPAVVTGNVKETSKYIAYAAIAIATVAGLRTLRGLIPRTNK